MLWGLLLFLLFSCGNGIAGQAVLLLLFLLLFRFCSYGWNEMRIEVSESDDCARFPFPC